MQERLVTIDRVYEREYDFIVRSLKKNKIVWAEETLGRRLAIYVATAGEREERFFSSILEEVLMTAFKWHYYTQRSDFVCDKIEDKALKYCLLDFDSGAERRYFREKIFCENAIHIDPIYYFGMGVVKAVWDSYVELINDFYSTYPMRSDKLELIGYMVSLNERKGYEKRLKYYITDEKEDNVLQNIFYYGERSVKIPKDSKGILSLVNDIFGKFS